MPVPDPLVPFDAVTLIEFAPVGAAPGDVTVHVDVLDAPAASVSELVENVLLQPDGDAGSDDVSANVPDAQVALSLFVTVTVYASAVPALPDCDVGETLTLGAARVHGAITV